MKTREQAAATYINENRKNLNSDSVFTIARSDLYAHWNDAFLAGCEFEAQNHPKVWVLYAGFWYEVAGTSDEWNITWIHIYDEPPSKHIDRVKLSSTNGIKISSERPPKPQEL